MIEKFKKLQKDVLRKLDTTKLELKVRNYSKELSAQYLILGEIYYNNKREKRPVDEAQVKEILENIDGIRSRIKYLGRHITEIKQKGAAEESANKRTAAAEHDNVTLNRNKGDLVMKRTEQGIKFFWVCPLCSMQNNVETEACEACGHTLQNGSDK